ncbi:MAG: EamA family transporter RarD [Planctomycetota bacterium]
MTNSVRTGLLFSVIANVIWGLFPIFWSWLDGISAVDLVSHRIVWAFAFSILFVFGRIAWTDRSKRAARLALFSDSKTWLLHAAAAILITLNWLAFLWAVTNDRVLHSALGYYINPLFNVLLGVLVLGERLSKGRWVAIVIATVGVAVLSYATGEIPWVSLLMASSFAGYAFVKKHASLDALDGLAIEMSVIVAPTLIYLCFFLDPAKGFFIREGTQTAVLLIIGGLMTLTPLMFFSAATRRIPLSLVGMMQYVGPTLQFLVGVLYFEEKLSPLRLFGFVIVWLAVILFMSRRD